MGNLSNLVLYGNTNSDSISVTGSLSIYGNIKVSDISGYDRSITLANVTNGGVIINSTNSGYILMANSAGGQTRPNYLKSTANITNGTIIATTFSGTATNATTIGANTSTTVAKCSDRINWWKSTSAFSRTINYTGTIQASYIYFMGSNTDDTSNNKVGVQSTSIPISTKTIVGNVGGGAITSYPGLGTMKYIDGIKVGDLIFDTYGAIATVTSIKYNTNPTFAYPATIGYRVCWISQASWTCLEEGTLITMADMTQKPIEEVLPGELIMGYDFEKNEPTPAVVLTACATTNDDKTNYLIFENGEYVSCTNEHEFYSNTKKCFAFARDLEEGEKLLDIDGNEIELYAIHKDIYTFNFKQFYQLTTSNNTYFANGIMCAMGPGNKRNWLKYAKREEIPEEIEEIFKLDGREFHAHEFLGKDKEFVKKSLDVMENLKLRGNKIASLKQYLKDTDYIASKKSEGQEVDENILIQRQKNRDEINKLEKELDDIYWPEHNRLLSESSELGDDILLSNEERRSKYFFESCKRDNENFELFKKYYANS